MNNRFAVSLIAASLLTPGAAFAQSTTAQGAAEGAAAGGAGRRSGRRDGRRHRRRGCRRGLEIPNAVITGLPRERSVVVQERVVVGEPLPRLSNCAPCRSTPNIAMRSSMIAG